MLSVSWGTGKMLDLRPHRRHPPSGWTRSPRSDPPWGPCQYDCKMPSKTEGPPPNTSQGTSSGVRVSSWQCNKFPVAAHSRRLLQAQGPSPSVDYSTDHMDIERYMCIWIYVSNLQDIPTPSGVLACLLGILRCRRRRLVPGRDGITQPAQRSHQRSNKPLLCHDESSD